MNVATLKARHSKTAGNVYVPVDDMCKNTFAYLDFVFKTGRNVIVVMDGKPLAMLTP